MAKKTPTKEEKIQKSTAKGFFDKRSTQYGLQTAVTIIVLLGIFILINFIAQKELTRIDLTINKAHSLSEETKSVLKQIEEPIKISAFYQESNPEKQEFEELARSYETENDNISVEFIDPYLSPTKADEYGIDPDFPSLVLEKGEKREQINSSRERYITSALLSLINDERKKIYFTTGHNEKKTQTTEGDEADTYTNIREDLQQQIYDVEEITLLSSDIPEDAAAVIIAGPKTAFENAEIEKIKSYINDRKGRVMFLLDPLLDTEKSIGFEDILKEYGIKYTPGTIIDPVSSYRDFVDTPLFTVTSSHQVLEGIPQILLSGVAGVSKNDTIPENWVVTEHLSSSSGSWLESDPTAEDFRYNEDEDQIGPITAAVFARKETPTDKESTETAESDDARIVVIGDSEFVENVLLKTGPGVFNRGLFLNSVNWLTANEDLISIPQKVVENAPLAFTGQQLRTMLLSLVVIVPGAVVGIGIYITLQRRKAKK